VYGDDSLGDVAVFEVDGSGQLTFAVDVLGHDLTAAIGSHLAASSTLAVSSRARR